MRDTHDRSPGYRGDSEGPDESSTASDDPDRHEDPLELFIRTYEQFRRFRDEALHGVRSRYVADRPGGSIERENDVKFFKKASELLLDAGLTPITFLSRRFAVEPTVDIYPNVLLTFRGVKGRDLVRALAASSVVQECLLTSLQTQRQVAMSELAISPSAEYVVLNVNIALTSLFRFIMALKLGHQEIAARYASAARVQYVMARCDYDVAWRDVLDADVRKALLDG